jgi:hypothetical protein
VLRKPLLFFCNAECTNNNYHFQTLLALTLIFIIHQCVHFCGVTTAQPGAKKPGNLQFSNHEEVSVQKKQGNLNNIRICNERFYQVLANVSGVLAVECLQNNGGHNRTPAGGLNFNNTVEITKHTSGRDSTDTNGEVTTFVEVSNSNVPNITI